MTINNDEIDLRKLFGSLLDYKWWIVGFTFFTALIGVAYTLFATPIYTANASIQVESKSSGGVLKDFAGFLEEKSSSSTEVVILKSRMILSNTVEQLNLTTQVKPEFSLPFIGKGLARLQGEMPELYIAQFTPQDLAFSRLILEIGEQPDSFRLFSTAGELLLEGQAGKKYQLEPFSFAVTSLKGKPSQRFVVEKIPELTAITALQKQISISENGKQTGIIEIAMNGEDKKLIQRIVKSVSENYLLQNIARNSAEASKSLEFLTQQLPEIKDRLSEAENNLNEFRLKNESVDLNLETKSVLDTLVQLEAGLNELTIKESEISQRFTKRHPAYIALLDKRKVLKAERNRLNKQIEGLPNTQKEIIRLTRDLEVNQQIYLQILNKMQELEIVKASAIGNVRILDQAQVFSDPIAPKKLVIVLLALVIGAVFSSFAVILKTILHRGITSASEIEALGLATYAVIPYSEHQPQISVDKKPTDYKILSEHNPADLSIEALRGLRTSLHFAMLEAKNNILMITGTSPSVGKTFISLNLANILAKSGKKVLLIDADLRRSYLRNALKLDKSKGLSAFITQGLRYEEIIQPYLGFDVIVKGETPPNPSELLMNQRIEQLFHWASENYDIVLVDTPPILAVTDAGILGKYAGTTLLLSFFERTTENEIRQAKDRFEKNGVTIKGVILNGIKKQARNKYEYYAYDYK